MSEISYYNSLPPKGKPHLSNGNMSVIDFLNGIKYGKWKELVLPIRNEPDKENRSALKKKLVSVTLSGVFQERKEQNLISYSGFICIDVDNFTDKAGIIKDPYTYCCFDSVSGNGFAVVVKTKQETHKSHFKWLQKYYFEKYGIVIDPAPQNIASLRYISFDPLLEINEKSKVAGIYKEPKKLPTALPIILSGDKVGEYVAECVRSGKNIAPTYHEYLHLSFALASGFGESGRQYFHSLCSLDEKYNSIHADNQYNLALKRGVDKIGVGTFYFMLKNAGIKIIPDQQGALSAVVIAKKSGRNNEAIKQQLVEVNGMDEVSANNLINEVDNRSDISLPNLTKTPEHLITNLVEWMKLNHPLRKNEINSLIYENDVEVKKERLNTIYLRARSVFDDTAVTFELIDRIIISEFTPVFNPITEYIEKNMWRKSEGNIHALLCTIDSDTQGGAIFLKKWLLSIIAAYKGFPVRSVLALVGSQNSGKTEFFRRLLPSALKKYYAESKLDAGKDDDLLMCQKLIVMDDEMGGKSKDNEKRFKELTSKQIFSLRAPYARANEDFKRLAILCGTSNTNDVVNDRSGNTRVLPIEVKGINHAAYNEINKDELFMELYREFESGAEWQLTKDELALLQTTSDDFQTANFENELITKYFYPAIEGGGLVQYMTATEIKIELERASQQKINSMKLFGAELRKVFGVQKFKDKQKVYEVIRKENGSQSVF
jgi:predicted P-loop ATPase